MDHCLRTTKTNVALDFGKFPSSTRRDSSSSLDEEQPTSPSSTSPVGSPDNKSHHFFNYQRFSLNSVKGKAAALAQYVKKIDASNYYRDYPCGNESQLRDWDTW